MTLDPVSNSLGHRSFSWGYVFFTLTVVSVLLISGEIIMIITGGGVGDIITSYPCSGYTCYFGDSFCSPYPYHSLIGAIVLISITTFIIIITYLKIKEVKE